MKQNISFLLIFTIFIFYSCNLFAKSSSEKFDLTPKIKKGDSWKMVFTLGESQVDWNNNKKGESDSFTKKIIGTYGLKDLRVKTVWEVECLEAFKEKVVLKFTFRRLEQKNTMTENGKKFLNYNDTDFPLNLSLEKIAQINQFLNKSFTCELPWNTGEEIKILKNDFENETMNLPTTTFLNKGMSILMQINFGMNSKSYAGPNAVIMGLNFQRSIFPKNPVEVGETWNSEFNFGGVTVIQQMTLESFENGKALINTNFEGETNEITITPKSGLPQLLDLDGTLKIYSYDTPICNTQISGDFQNKDFNGIATFKINYPVTFDKIKVEVKNGVFKMPIDLKEPVSGVFTFQDIKTDFFLTPGMGVKINWKNEQPKALGFGADDLNAVFLFSENPFYYGYSTDDHTVKSIKEKTDAYLKKVDNILAQFKGKLSPDCEKYLLTESNFRIAYWYAYSTEDIERERTAPKLYGKNFDSAIADKNYNFFLNYVDSIPLLGSVSPYSDAYHSFIMEYLNIRQRNFLYELGRRRIENNYRENLLFAAIQYIGYPYYFSSYKILESAILDGDKAKITKELDEFYTLPCNPVFKNALINLINEMELIEIGHAFPYPEITDINGSIQKIPKGNFCIIDLNSSYFMTQPQHKEELEELTRIIKENKRFIKINYVVIRPDFAKGKMIETPSNDTVNFIHIYLPKDNISLLEKCQVTVNKQRILLLDKNLKIINNNLKRIKKYSGHDFPKILDDYFDSQNQPTSQAGNSRLLLIILASLFGFGLLSWFVIRIRTKQIAKKEAAKRKLSELELRAIRSQMNPHFMFNSLNSIQNLVNKNKIEETNIYLSEFAELMRLVLNNSEKQLVPLEEELKLIQSYLDLEKLRIPFHFEIIIDPSLIVSDEEIPGMLIQPFVENAVVHGIAPQKGGKIKVALKKEKSKIICEITDDGIGISKRSTQRNGNGKAIKMVRERFNLVNSQNKEPLTLEIIDRKEFNEKGTLVRIGIPV